MKRLFVMLALALILASIPVTTGCEYPIPECSPMMIDCDLLTGGQ